MYDIIIIGSGPGGHSAAIRAAQLGKKVAVVERAELGGVCVNWGCMPTKSLLKSAQIYEDALHSSTFGVEIAGEVFPNLPKIVERSRAIAAQMSSGIAHSFKKLGIETICGEGKIIEKGVVEVGGERYEAEHIILATGARPRRVAAIPVDGIKVITSKEALALTELPRSMVVVGSGAIGLEFASFYSSLGVSVTIVEYLPRIAPLEDSDISSALERAFRKRKVKVMTSTSVLGVTTSQSGCSVEIEGKKGAQTIECDVVLSAVGVETNVTGLGLEELGIKTERGFIEIDMSTYQTSMEGVYAIGDIVRGPALAHVAMLEALHCVSAICGVEHRAVNYDLIPSCIYTFAEVASVGLTEEQALEKYGAVKVGKFAMLASGKAAVAGERDGLVKLVFTGESDLLVGAHLMGHSTTEMLAGLTTLMEKGATASDIISACHPHPTVSEVIMEAAMATIGASAHGESYTKTK